MDFIHRKAQNQKNCLSSKQQRITCRPQGIRGGGFLSLFLKRRPTQTSSQGIGGGRFLDLLKPPPYIDHNA